MIIKFQTAIITYMYFNISKRKPFCISTPGDPATQPARPASQPDQPASRPASQPTSQPDTS